MRAIIMAGGKGVRLAPVTEVIPKPLVPIGGMPVMEIVIRQLKQHGFRWITLAVGYMGELIQAYFQDGARWHLKIDYYFESEALGTVGALSMIEGLNDTFMVMNADILTNLNYRELVDYHKARRTIATVGACERQESINFGVIIKDGDWRIKDYLEKPISSYLVSMGVYVFDPPVLTYLKKGSYLDFPDLVKILIDAGQPINCYTFDGYWLDIGRHSDYDQATEDFEAMRKDLGLCGQ
jgi:NDP-sugar pyrophosphorylase family protein